MFTTWVEDSNFGFYDNNYIYTVLNGNISTRYECVINHLKTFHGLDNCP